ncbi:NAD(P)-binding protein [Linderina pennispora]|uniref:NAD(P)-binding protein n=1 Tax=Linderina pennispora TaxID=61395 RepID=A0A1Y1W591_9FUNG|nr:NAD(P)-binding protein [Linderina pennispora]ORX68691.1 NAD(P)-binding protein [Linderina pennispora]
MSSSAEVVVIFGATGQQGASVLRSLAGSPNYHIRAVTRSTSSANAQRLSHEYPSVELVEADLEDINTVMSAVSGANIVFGVTQFFQSAIMNSDDPVEREYQQGRNLVDACVKQNVPYVIFSSCRSAKHETNGEIGDIAFFDGKFRVQEYLLSQPINATVILLAAYFQNFLTRAQLADDGAVEFWYSGDLDGPVMQVDPDRDTGPVVRYIIENRKGYFGKAVPVTGGAYSPQQVADAFSRVAGVPTRLENMAPEKLISDDMRNMFKFFARHDWLGNPDEIRQFNAKVGHEFSTPDIFWQTNGWRGPE